MVQKIIQTARNMGKSEKMIADLTAKLNTAQRQRVDAEQQRDKAIEAHRKLLGASSIVEEKRDEAEAEVTRLRGELGKAYRERDELKKQCDAEFFDRRAASGAPDPGTLWKEVYDKAITLLNAAMARNAELQADQVCDEKMLHAQRATLIQTRLIIRNAELSANALILSSFNSLRRHNYWGPRCVVRDEHYDEALKWALAVRKAIAAEGVDATCPPRS